MEGGQATAPRGSERAEAIRSRLAEILGEPPSGEVRRLSGGASRETYLYDRGGRGRLILQCEHAGKPTGEPPGQAALLQAAAAAGVPVAAVVAHGAGDPVLGVAWTLVEAVPGTSDPAEILTSASPQSLLDDIAGALAAVHRMPADPALAPPAEEPLAQLRALHDHLGEPHPVFELAFRTLGEDVAPAPTALVHGDFRIGNLMVDGDRVTGVLDWELTHLGDPAEDLGWLCVPAWRFSRPDRPAGGLGTREELLAAYARHAGSAPSMQQLRRWELAGTLRWGVICVMQAFSHLSGARRSVEHAVIGRRACEVEWDLLELLDPGSSEPSPGGTDPADPPPLPPGPHDRPTALELIDAARGALGDQVLPLLDGRPAFELRVSLRALGMVRRELELSTRHAQVRAAALADLGVDDERALAAAIRDGAFEERRGELLAALRALARAKLEAANPGYLKTYENDREET